MYNDHGDGFDPTTTEIHRGHRPPAHAQHHYRNAPPIYARWDDGRADCEVRD